MPDELPSCDFSAGGSIRRCLTCFIGWGVVDGILVSLSHGHPPWHGINTTTGAGLQQHKCHGKAILDRAPDVPPMPGDEMDP